MKSLPCVALPVCGALLLSAAATASAAVPATIRVEGANATLIDQRNQSSAETLVADRTDGGVRTVPGPSALGQLTRAAARAGVPVRVSFSDAFGPLASVVERIGPHDQGRAFEGPGYWLFKVNHRASEQAANLHLLRRGDEVLWYFTANFDALELALRVPARPLRAGQRFTVRVVAYDAAGTAKPAAGARVTYAGRPSRADRSGRVTLRVVAGTRALRAERAGDIRTATERVCGYRVSARQCHARRPFGATLRVASDGRTSAGWGAAAPVLRTIAAGRAGSPIAISWRGNTWRDPAQVRSVAATLVARFLS